MSDLDQLTRAAKLLDPLSAEPEPSRQKFAEALCEIELTIRTSPLDPGPAYDLPTRIRMLYERLRR